MTERLSNERLGCLDSGCVFAPLRDNSGQHTNGGCRCLKELPPKLRRDLRALVDEVRERREAARRLRRLASCLPEDHAFRVHDVLSEAGIEDA